MYVQQLVSCTVHNCKSTLFDNSTPVVLVPTGRVATYVVDVLIGITYVYTHVLFSETLNYTCVYSNLAQMYLTTT